MMTFGDIRITLWLFFFSAVLLSSSKATAQYYEQPAEVFVGYSHLQLEPGAELETAGLNGWNAALTGYMNEWLGFCVEFGGNYGTTDGPSFANLSHVDVEQWNYLFGPQIRIVRAPRFAASALALFGASRGDADPDTFVVDGTPVRLSIKQTKFAAAFGAALDFNVTSRVAWRVQPALFVTSFSGERQKNFRIATGIVFRFGTRN